MADVFDASPRPAYEQIARIEGQSNFLSLLAGVEAGPDTTEIMGALAFARAAGCIPETLEANVAQSVLYRLPLMSIVFHAVRKEFRPPEKDWPWIQGAVADAFLLLRTSQCVPLHIRAKRFRVDISAYSAMRKTAAGVFADMLDRAQREWNRARKSEIPGKCHSHHVGETKADFVQGTHCFVTQPRVGPDLDHEGTVRMMGMEDRLAWDWRQEIRPGPVLTLHGQEAEAHCKRFPAWPASRTRKTIE